MAKVYCTLRVSMPSWAWVVTFVIRRSVFKCKFQCPHGLELLLASPKEHLQAYTFQCPHGLELSLHTSAVDQASGSFQCPHGLELLRQWWCYSHQGKNRLNALTGLYLISTLMARKLSCFLVQCCVNALSGLYLISTVPLQKSRFYAVSRACFCRYLSEYSDNSRFSCMLTF